ncbi:MAG: hypothetical protein GY906_23860 [bacterium]|nr:hypothetical protein [bacterium]
MIYKIKTEIKMCLDMLYPDKERRSQFSVETMADSPLIRITRTRGNWSRSWLVDAERANRARFLLQHVEALVKGRHNVRSAF